MNQIPKPIKTVFLFLCFFIFTFAVAAQAHIDQKHPDSSPLKITILPCTDPVKTYKNFHHLAHYLEKKINRDVIIQVPRNHHAFLRIIREHETDFTYQTAHIYIALENSFNRHSSLSALTPDGKRQHKAFLITRSDSSIKNIEDLRGRSILFGSEQSTVKTLASKLLLKNHGIDEEKDLQDYSYGDSCEKNAFNVYLKAFEAGFVCDYSYNSLMSEEDPDWPIPPGSLKIVAETMSVPTWIFSALNTVEVSTVKAVQAALLALTSTNVEHQKILRSIESGGFVVTDEKDLLMLRKQLTGP
ncbi:MAG: phosphate/phosphite/phosphonate ABC transporter substrate-binding protein [Desulfobulbaceae bacterium]|nr:phosphate/phosphite/phosphonate ABC transporter substrate-binding protein [Desulfobulbaceae bacterium]